jgi:hypothetical protein
MRSDELVNKTNGDKPRCFQLMVLMILQIITVTKPSKEGFASSEVTISFRSNQKDGVS